MKHLKWIFLFFPLLSFGQGEANNVHITGSIVNAKGQSVKITQRMGKKFETIAKTSIEEDGSFALDLKMKNPEYYNFKLSNGQAINLIVELQDTIKVYGDASQFSSISNIINSEASTLLNDFMSQYNDFKEVQDSLRAALKNSENPKAKRKEVQQYFQPIAKRFQQKRNKFIKQHKNSPAVIGPLNSINYQRETELWTDVANSIIQSMEGSQVAQSLSANLKKIKQQKAKKEAQRMKVGEKAPEIALPNPKGDTVRLSDLKGKVVLIDFWASWCGPCRKENPNVVATYEKFNEQGFEIFSVSLDKNKSKWKKAIAADNLRWDYHVSDLKGWRNSAAQAYNVSSIPFTVLIDREGKVIKTRLRGEGLKEELNKIFSSN